MVQFGAKTLIQNQQVWEGAWLWKRRLSASPQIRTQAPCTETPVLLVGGALDGTVTLETTRLAYGRLEALKMKRVQYLELPCLAHEISEEVVGLAPPHA